MPFRINCKHISLTYSQSNLEKNELFSFLKEKFLPAGILLCRESHRDGGHHYHAYLRSHTKFNIRDERAFDHGNEHPNIQPTRNVKQWLDYCRKEDAEPLEEGTLDDASSKRKWAEVAECATKEEFFQTIKEVSYRDFVLGYDKIQYFANEFYSKQEVYVPRYTEFQPTANMVRWVNQRLLEERPKSLILCGPSRLGKTQWARSLGRHIYWPNSSNIDEWDPEAEYLVIDDIDYKFIPCKKGLLGAQEYVTLTDKYRKKKTLKWGKPCILLCNEDQDPFNFIVTDEKRWLEANTIYSKITMPLF